MNFKQALYQAIAKMGIKFLTLFFPEYFAGEPIKPTDRFIECPFVIRNLPKLPARVLDVGSAGSFFPLLLAGLGYEVTGLDIREYAIINKINFINFRFVKADIKKCSLPDAYFDAITSISTIEHIGLAGRYTEKEESAGDRVAVSQMERLLKPGGRIILTFPFGKAKIVRPYSRIYGPKEVNELICGLSIQKEEYYMQDKDDDWFQCTREAAKEIEATAYRGPICLLVLKKG